ncbi:Zinc finger BED domain-containing protein RICESLEEPER 2 [Colletotrichum fructicola]|nr:Zinc finger BED domain-containing protein RICESLEEPER 2 [Colletotrichum fructicola]
MPVAKEAALARAAKPTSQAPDAARSSVQQVRRVPRPKAVRCSAKGTACASFDGEFDWKKRLEAKLGPATTAIVFTGDFVLTPAFCEHCPDLKVLELTAASRRQTMIAGEGFRVIKEHSEWPPGLRKLKLSAECYAHEKTFMSPMRKMSKAREQLLIKLVESLSISDLQPILWGKRRFVVEEQLARKEKAVQLGYGLMASSLSNSHATTKLGQPPGVADDVTKRGGPNSSPQSPPALLKSIYVGFIILALVAIIRDLALTAIIGQDLSFNHFDDTFLQRLLRFHNVDLFAQVPWGKTSMADHLETIWSRGRATVKAELRDASTRIHLPFDLWTSPNIYAFMAVTAHFLNSKGKHQSRLLAFTQQQGNHFGVDLATTLEDTVTDWGLVNRIGIVICDNATNSDTCLASFYPWINPRMTSRDCKAHRMRCHGHILNLVAKSLLFGSDFEIFEAESEFYRTVHRDEEDLKLWRKTGPVGKLRNIVRFIRASPKRSERFKKVAKAVGGGSHYCLFTRSSSELQLILNNNTR